jgi:hypothetical protein
MSNRRKLSDAFIMPFTLGFIFGGLATGFVVSFVLGEPVRLLGIGGLLSKTVWVAHWLATVLLSVVIATLLECGIVRILGSLAPSRLLPRLRPLGLFVVGGVAACGCTVASCLTIDLGPHPGELWKGPSPPFPYYVILVCAIIPFVLLRRTTWLEECAGDSRAEGPAVEPAKGAALEND